MTRLPVIFSFFLFLALAATLAYWVLQWTAPAPRGVSAPPKSERTATPLTAAASLFGGRSQGSTLANLQLRGVVHSGRSSDSVAIIAVEGKPPRAISVDSEIAPGVTVKEILSKTVVLSEKGAERELSLPAFVAQESNAPVPQAVMPPPANPAQTNPPGVMSGGINTGASGSSSSSGSGGSGSGNSSGTQGSGMISPPPERSKIQPQSHVVPSAPAPVPEPARPQSRQ